MRQFYLLGMGVFLLFATGCSQGKERERVVGETYVHKYGMQVASKEWSNRGKNGQVISRLDNGIEVKRNYVNGLLDGEVVYTFPHDSRIAKVERYEMGTLNAKRRHYPSGNPMDEVLYEGDGLRTVTSWYHEGTPKSLEHFEGERLVSGEYYTTDHQVESSVENGEGLRITRDQFGQLSTHDQFSEGLLLSQMRYYPDGAPREQIPYVNGLIEGECKYFLPTGETERIEEWREGNREGITTLLQDGRVVAKIPYVNNLKHGVEQHFGGNGSVVEEISWKEGKRHGPSYTYVADTTKVEWYKENRRVSENQFLKGHH